MKSTEKEKNESKKIEQFQEGHLPYYHVRVWHPREEAKIIGWKWWDNWLLRRF